MYISIKKLQKTDASWVWIKKIPLSSRQAACISLVNHLPLLPSGSDGVGRRPIAQNLPISTEGETEREGFEPSVPARVHTLSKRTPSATRSSLQWAYWTHAERAVSFSGERGIRTLGTVNSTTDFESARFNRSRISPKKHVAKRIRTSGL